MKLKAYINKLILVLLFAGVFLSFTNRVSDSDIWWHLTLGRLIYANHAIVQTDTLSYTRAGVAHLNYEWLFDAVIYPVYKFFGFKGIILFRGLSILAVFIIIYFLLTLYEIDFLQKILTLFLVFFFILHRPQERPELFTLICLTAFLYILEKARFYPKTKLIYLLPVIFLVWVNAHGGYFVGIMFLFFYIIGSKSRKLYLISLALCIPVSFINPYGASIHTIPLLHFFNFSVITEPLIAEWQGTYLPGNIILLLTIVAAWILLLYKYLKFKVLDIIQFLIYAVFSYLSVKYVRNIILVGLVMVPFISKDMKYFWKIPKRIKLTLYIPVVLVILIFTGSRLKMISAQESVNWNKFPVDACKFIKNIPEDGNIYNPYNFGGFIEWYFEGKRKVFFDGRHIFYDLLTEDEASRRAGPVVFARFLDKYKVDYVMMKYPGVYKTVNGFKRSVLPFYFPKNEWALVYWDDLVLVYVKRESKYAKLISEYEFKYFNPDDYHYIEWQTENKKIPLKFVTEELQRQHSLYPDQKLNKYFLGTFIADKNTVQY